MNTQIKAEELRIGNYLERNGLMQITAIHKAKIKIYDHFNKMQHEYFFMVDTFKGLPITEELLLKAGFVAMEDDPDILYYIKGDFAINSFEDHSKMWMRYCTPSGEIRHFHQLQNIYFSLLGKELII